MSSRSIIARTFLSIVAVVALAVGVRLAYTAYETEKVLQICINNGPCPYNVTGFQLQSMLSTVHGQSYIGIGLAVIGILGLAYFVLVIGLTTKTE